MAFDLCIETNKLYSPKQFETFGFPYLSEIHDHLTSQGTSIVLSHICGEQNLNLPYWAKVPMGNPGICSIGSQIEIATAIEHLGDKAIIAGNVEPHILQTAEPEQVYELCRQAIIMGKKAPHGFMLMSGCETPPDTPPYNVYMMRKAIDDFGWYN